MNTKQYRSIWLVSDYLGHKWTNNIGMFADLGIDEINNIIAEKLSSVSAGWYENERIAHGYPLDTIEGVFFARSSAGPVNVAVDKDGTATFMVIEKDTPSVSVTCLSDGPVRVNIINLTEYVQEFIPSIVGYWINRSIERGVLDVYAGAVAKELALKPLQKLLKKRFKAAFEA